MPIGQNRIPFNQQVGTEDYYIQTKNKEFILTQIPVLLEQKISQAMVWVWQEPSLTSNALQMIGDLKNKHPHIKKTGYAYYAQGLACSRGEVIILYPLFQFIEKQDTTIMK